MTCDAVSFAVAGLIYSISFALCASVIAAMYILLKGSKK